MIGIGVYAGILITLGVWCLARPSVVLAMVFLLFALDQWGAALASGFIPTSAFTNYVAAGMTAFAIIVLFLFGRPHRLLSGPAFWTILALFVYAFISMTWVSVPGKAAGVWAVNFQYLIVFLCGAPLLVQDIDDVDVMMRALLLIGAPFVACLDFLLEWGYRGIIGADGEAIRLPLALGQFGGYMVIIGALFSPGRQLAWIVLRVAAVVLGALLILKTGSRGQFLSAVLCTTIVLGLGRSNVSPIKLVLATLFGGLTLVLAYFAAITYMQSDPTLSQVAGRWSIDRLFEDYGERSIRVLRIEAMMEAWQSSPGTMLVGLGNSAGYDPNITNCTSPVGCYPHNLPVEILTEEGLIGAGLYAGLILYIGFIGIRALSDQGIDRYYKPILSVLFAFVVFEFLLSLKQGSLLGNWRLFLFIILLERTIDLLRNPVTTTEETTLAEPRTERLRTMLARR